MSSGEFGSGVALSAAAPRRAALERPGWGRGMILGGFVLLIVVRLFTEVVPVLPRAANFIDLPLLLALLVYAAAIAKKQSTVKPWFMSTVLAFAVVWGISALSNLERLQMAPALLFLYGFLGPLVFYLVTLRTWQPGGARTASRTLVMLGVLQFVVVLVAQVPEFLSTGDPDVISGTFGENPYQLVFFLIVVGAHVAGTAVFEPGRLISRLAIPFLLGCFVVIFLAQYRALVVSTFIAVMVTGILLAQARSGTSGGRAAAGRLKAIVVSFAVIIALLGAFTFAAIRFPELKFLSAIEAFRDDPDLLLEAGKIHAAGDVLEVYQLEPRYVAFGTGPGTYSSRAWYTFSFFESTSESNVAGEYVQRLTGGVVYRTDVSERFVMPRARDERAVLGSYALTSPFSSYLALAAEVGLVGLALIVSIYVVAIGRCFAIARSAIRSFIPGDSLPALAIAAVIAPLTLFQMAILDNWLEVVRVAAPTWVLIAIVHSEARYRKARASG
ncbi:MAG: hypothetical protein ACRDLB_13705 [Actinomycetota bacterium]